MTSLSLEIPCQPQALADVMERLDIFARANALSSTTHHHVQLIVEELVLNAIRYGGLPETAHIDLAIRTESNDLLIDIRDRGRPFDPTQHKTPDVTLSIEDRPIGGLGVYLSQVLADEIHYCHENGENRISLRKRIHRDSPCVD